MDANALADLLTAAKAAGFFGVAIVNQGGTKTPYFAACLDSSGKIGSPRNWNTHETPEAALADLATLLR